MKGTVSESAERGLITEIPVNCAWGGCMDDLADGSPGFGERWELFRSFNPPCSGMQAWVVRARSSTQQCDRVIKCGDWHDLGVRDGGLRRAGLAVRPTVDKMLVWGHPSWLNLVHRWCAQSSEHEHLPYKDFEWPGNGRLLVY